MENCNTTNGMSSRNILFIAPSFFGYENDIIETLKSKGYNVYYVQENVDSTNLSYRLLNKLPNKYRENIVNKHFIDIFKKYKEKGINFDIVFGIRLDHFNDVILTALKGLFPLAKYVCYYWDSVRNMRNAELVANFFDKVYTFDKKDAEVNSGWIFRPLFYNKDFQNCRNKRNKTIDILFVASLMPKRADLFKKLSKICREYNLNLFTFFYCKIYVYLVNRSLYNDVPFSLIHGKGMSRKQLISRFEDSKVIFDCSHPDQTGLTMRTIECIGAKKKMITTNKTIINYDFYDKANILIIDENLDSNAINEFLKCPNYKELPLDVYDKYSIDSWVEYIIN